MRTYQFWVPEEVSFLRENYPVMTTKDIAQKLHRSVGGVRAKTEELLLRKTKPKHPWTDQEVQKLIALYCESSKEELLRNLPNRTWRSIRYKATALRLRRKRNALVWSENELRILKENYKKMTAKEVAKLLPGRSERAIRRKLYLIKFPWKPRYKADITLTDRQLGYLAAALDGEGSVSLILVRPQNWLRPSVEISNTDMSFLNKIREMLPNLGFIRARKPKGKRKKAYGFVIQRLANVYPLLKVLLPELTAKKRRAELLIDFCESRLSHGKLYYCPYTEREWEIYYELRKLNRRGGG
jgi:hypothetical protein